jgi:hypothetical protein
MVVVLYATYLYSSPDRRPSSMTATSSTEYREPELDADEERQFYDSERTPALAEKAS